MTYALQWIAFLLGAVIGALGMKIYRLSKELRGWKKLAELRALSDHFQMLSADFHEDAERTPAWVEKETNGTLQ